MKKDLKGLLQTRYPSIYGDCQRWSCLDGWFGILNVLGERLTHYERISGRSAGITDIKEKYGIIDIDCSSGDDAPEAMVYMAIQVSGITCEICGNAGELQDNGHLLSTRCKEHKKTSDQQAAAEGASYVGPIGDVNW